MAHDPFALVSPDAQLGVDVQVGPFSIIESGAVVGDRCRIGSRSTIKSGVTLGADNVVEEGVVLGGKPQHLMRIENPGPIVIGDRNTIRENVTVHRAMHSDGTTRIGSDCLIMVGAHIAHDCQVGSNVILTNNVLLGGHVSVGDRACLGGAVAVHQHCRIGRLAMVGGLARVAQDVPPFVMVDGDSSLLVGLNRVGLRRAGFSSDQVAELKAAYRVFFRSGLSFDERLEALATEFHSDLTAEFEEFFRGGARGFVRERRSPPSIAIRPIHDEVADRQEQERQPPIRKVG